MEKKKTKLITRLRNKYKLVLMKATTYEEKISIILTPLNVFIVFSSLFILFSFLIISLILYTPLKYYVPGFSDDFELKKQNIELSLKLDSLLLANEQNEKYLNSVKLILKGENPDSMDNKLSEKKDSLAGSQINPPSETELALRKEAELIERSTGYLGTGSTDKKINILPFFNPIKGRISDTFNISTQHFAVDLVAAPDEPVKATLNGTVIFAGWTPETGHVIALQHENNIISIYKHNSVLLKKIGNFVDAGEAIAIIGNSGELTSGEHLHFELWHNGVPVNPANFILFNR